MEETPQRLDRVARIEALGIDVEQAYATGDEPAPLLIEERVAPVVRYLRAGSNVALIGANGSGRASTACAVRRSEAWEEGGNTQLTMRLTRAAHPNSWPVYRTSVRQLLDGAIYTGNLEQKFNLILQRTTDPVIVVLPSAHTAIGAWRGSGDSLDLVDLLGDFVAHPCIHMIVTTTPDGWARLQAASPSFTSSFMTIDVASPDDVEARRIVSHVLDHRSGYAPACDSDAVDEAFRLASRYFAHEGPLGPMLKLLRGAAPRKADRVDAEAIRLECARLLGLQRRWIGIDRPPSAKTILAELEATVVGQRTACQAIADDLVAVAHGFRKAGRPAASYLLAGTPGVGKTSLACAVQRVLGGPDAVPLRFDCTEYAASPLDALRLLSDQAGSLTTGLVERPGAVVLLDEVDRLHPGARDLLYQILGEGRLTSLGGNTVSCSNAVFFLTTNVGSRSWLRPIMSERDEARAQATSRRACGDMLGAAIASRLTRILIMPPLGLEHSEWIVRAELARIASSPGIAERGITLRFTDDLVAGLAEAGLSPTNGARGIDKVIHEVVEIPMSKFLGTRRRSPAAIELDAICHAGVLQGARVSVVDDSDRASRDGSTAHLWN